MIVGPFIPMRYIIILLFFISYPAFSTDLESAIEQSKNKTLWQHHEWLNLLFYEKTAHGHISKVSSPEFFIAKDGNKSPYLELIATLKVIYGNDKELRCRFIARTDWLIKKLSLATLESKDYLSECKEFNEWAKPSQTNSISLIFATGYFGNPASYYGHSLIKFDQLSAGQGLNDTVVNFGAETPENENPLIYMIKGILGGYQAQFTTGRLYEHETIYGQVELRDLWIYKLNLSADERLLLQKHLWELRGQSFQYLFSSENCAYFIARSIENASGKTIVSNHPSKSAWVIPINGFMELNQQGLINEIKYIPSRSSQLEKEFNELSNIDKEQLTNLSFSDFVDFDQTLITPNVSEQLLRTSISYASYMVSADNGNKEYWKSIRKRLITHRYSLPPASANSQNNVNIPKKAPPHSGDKPSRVGISPWLQGNRNTGITLSLRVANSDQLSKRQGRIPYSSLEMLKIEADITENRVDLHQLTFVDIISPNISKTGLKGDGGYSWKLSAIVSPYNFKCNSCLIAASTAGLGKTLDFGNSAVYSYLVGKINTPYRNESNFSAGVNLGYISQANSYIQPLLDITYLRGIDNTETERLLWKAEARYLSGDNWDNRIKYEYQDENRLTLEFGYLF